MRFILFVLLQVYVFNNIQFSGLINPYFYILFVLLLPFETPKWLLLISSFLLGLSIDFLSHTPGMHAFACVIMAYLRPFVLSVLAPREGYSQGSLPRIGFYGFSWFLKYTLILSLIHHLSLFFVELYTLKFFFSTLFRAIFSYHHYQHDYLLSQYLVFRDK
ncbi:MAG: rod shape-determining protein MreD [Bacteroidales bacterium]|nr:rod shape-determining protein MreD [Bacteroidales bacterium]